MAAHGEDFQAGTLIFAQGLNGYELVATWFVECRVLMYSGASRKAIAKKAWEKLSMYRNRVLRNWVRLAALTSTTISVALAAWAQYPQTQAPTGQYPPGQYPPGQRPQPVALQCQSALADQVSADAGRRVTLTLDSQNSYSVGNERQGLRGRLRYGIGPPNGWRVATYDCVVNVRQNRVERVTYSPGAISGGYWPGGPDGPIVTNYPRVRVDTSGRGSFNSRFAGNAQISRGWVDSTGRPAVALSGGNFRITFFGVVESSDGNREFTMWITGSDRGVAQGSAQVRLNRDRNEVEMINLNGRIGRDNFAGNFSR
jgi:hypothetical protein